MRKRKIKIDDFELRVIVKALNELRNQFIANNKPTEDIDILLFRLLI